MKSFLAAKRAAFAAGLALSLTVIPASAGIPVFDGGNLAQNIISAIQAVMAVQKQIEQYTTQLDQFENELTNTLNPDSWHWDQAQRTMSDLINTVDTINGYKTTAGSLNSYLNKFQDLSYYRTSPCFTQGGCSAAQLAQLRDLNKTGFESRKKSNDNVFKGLDKQQQQLDADARKLEQLQSAAQGSEGRMQAIQFANQFASEQAAQLMQIRGLLVAQQGAVAAKEQAQLDREAQINASGEHLRSGDYVASPVRRW